MDIEDTKPDLKGLFATIGLTPFAFATITALHGLDLLGGVKFGIALFSIGAGLFLGSIHLSRKLSFRSAQLFAIAGFILLLVEGVVLLFLIRSWLD